MLKLLFICSRNQWRSPTAEALYRDDPRVTVRSAGTSASARRKVSAALLEWADVILVMEQEHLRRLRQDFRESLHEREIVVLGIPDDFEYMDPELVRLLREQTEPVIEELRP